MANKYKFIPNVYVLYNVTDTRFFMRLLFMLVILVFALMKSRLSMFDNIDIIFSIHACMHMEYFIEDKCVQNV